MYQPTNPNQQQAFMITAPMQPQYNVQYHNLTPVTTTNTKSWLLISVGIVQLVLSLTLLCFCVWILSINSKLPLTYLTISSCIYHVILCILALIGGLNVTNRRCLIGVCLGIAIVGAAIITPVTLGLNVGSYFSCRHDCKSFWSGSKQGEYNESYFNKPTCEHIETIFIPVIISVSIQEILDLIVSIVNCANICQCCGAQPQVTPGQVIQPQFNPQLYDNNFTNSSQPPPYTSITAPPVQQIGNYDLNVPQSTVDK